MESNSINLDDSAEELYAQLGGVEVQKLEKIEFNGTDRLEQSLCEERRRYDALRALFVNLVYQVGIYLNSCSKNGEEDLIKRTLAQFANIFGKLSKNPEAGNKALIRYKGAFGGDQIDKKTDYEILSRAISFDTAVVHAISKGQGTDSSQLLEKLTRGFDTLWNHNIVNFLLKIPRSRPELQRLLLSLQFAARYFTAIEKNSPVTIPMSGKPVSIQPIHNENSVPDLNLTLLAVLNGLSSERMQAMVNKVDSFMRSSEYKTKKYRYTSVYDAILQVKQFRSRFRPSPIEVNNIKWLMVNDEETPVSDQMADVARLVMDSSGGSGVETARVLKSVYGEDYAKIDSRQIAERLSLSSGLLKTIDTESKSEDMETEVINNMEERLSQVKEDVYDNIQIEGDQIKAYTPGKGTVTEKVHTKIGKIVSFQNQKKDDANGPPCN
jgi:hypothetical protein